MRKLLGLLAALGLTTTTASAVVACNDPVDQEANVNEVAVKLTVTLVKDAKIGDVKIAIARQNITAEGKEADREVNCQEAALKAVKAIEGVEEVVLKDAPTSKVEETVKPVVFDTSVKVTYKVTDGTVSKFDLSTIKELDLGEIKDNDATTIKAKLGEELNSSLTEAMLAEIDITDIKDTTATIKPISTAKLVEKEGSVKFTVKPTGSSTNN